MSRTTLEHELVIDRYRNLIAHCLCDRWVMRSLTGARETETEIWARANRAYQEHVNY